MRFDVNAFIKSITNYYCIIERDKALFGWTPDSGKTSWFSPFDGMFEDLNFIKIQLDV